MNRTLIRLVVAVLVSGLVQWSCRTEHDVAVYPGFPDLTIEEAKVWMQSQPAGAREAAKKKAAKRTEYWNAAQKRTYKNGLPVVVVPLAYNYQNSASFWGSKPQKGGKYDESDLFIQKKLLVYKDTKGHMQADVVSIIPTNTSRKKNKKTKGDDFDGYVLAYNNSETKFMGGWYYENGKAKRRARSTGSKNGRVVQSDCDILVYQSSGGQQSSQVGTGDSSPADGFYDSGGNYWQLAYTVTMDCGGNGPSPGPGGDNDPNMGDPGWIWNNSDQGGGGGSGGLIPPEAPYTPVMITDEGYVGANAADNFFYDMNYNHSPSIYFDEEEKEVIREYPQLIISVSNYIQQYNQKPDGSNAFILSYEDQQQYPRFTEIVKGMPSFVEQNDRVKQALIRHTNLSWSKIKVLLKFGSGPKLLVYDLNPSTLYGHTIHPGYPESRIDIQASFVRGLEAANLSGTKQATSFLLSVTLLHELTHYGAVDGERNETRIDEFGADFEREVMGTTITKDNAGQLLVKFNKLN